MWFKEEPSQYSMGQTAQSLTCSIMEKLHKGLDECPRILLSWFRARNFAAAWFTRFTMKFSGIFSRPSFFASTFLHCKRKKTAYPRSGLACLSSMKGAQTVVSYVAQNNIGHTFTGFLTRFIQLRSCLLVRSSDVTCYIGYKVNFWLVLIITVL